MEVELIDDEAETVNATAIVSDDESGGNKEGGKDDGSADGGDNGGDDDTDLKPKAKNREPVDINRANQILNHPGETKLKQLAQKLNWTLTGTLLICEFCAKSKATAKPTKKETEKKAEAPGERLHMDKSGPYKLTRGKNRHWLLVVDQKTNRAWSFFAPSKTDFDESIQSLFQRLKAGGNPVKYLRLDNAPEWNSLKPTCVELAITMEFTAPETAQFNGVVEREFPTIRNQAMACMLASEMSTGEQMLHWAHAVHDCTITRNLQPRGEYENAYVPFGEQPPVKPRTW